MSSRRSTKSRHPQAVALPTEGERLAALTGDAEVPFLREAMSLRGNLWERWAELEAAAATRDPLAEMFGPVFEAARKAPLDRQAAFRFAVRASMAEHPGWSALSRADQDLLLLAARSMLHEGRAEARRPRLVTTCEPLDYLIDHILPKHSVTAMVGLPGEGKSWLGLEMAALLGSDSTRLFGDTLRVHEHGPVWYFLSEDAHGFAARRRAWENKHGAAPNLHLFDEVPHLSGSLGDLLAFLRAAQAQRPEDHPVLIVIDIFADTMSGEDENAAATMVPVLRRARIISKLLDATVLLIHHASKARPEDARGSVAFKGALDVMNAVVQDAKGIALRPIKYKSDPLQKEIRFHIADNVLQPGAADAGSTWVVTYTRELGAIALAHTLLDIASQSYVTRTELRVALGTAYPEWFGPTVVRNTAADRITKVIDDCLSNGWAVMKGSRYTIGSKTPPPMPPADLSEVM